MGQRWGVKGWGIFQCCQCGTERGKVPCREKRAQLQEPSCVFRCPGRIVQHCVLWSMEARPAFSQETTKIAAGLMESESGDTAEEPQHCPPVVTPARQLESVFLLHWSEALKWICTFYFPFLPEIQAKECLVIMSTVANFAQSSVIYFPLVLVFSIYIVQLLPTS